MAMIPANTTGYCIRLRASLIRKPIPDVAAIISAPTTAIAVVGVIMDLAISLIGKLCTPWEKGR